MSKKRASLGLIVVGALTGVVIAGCKKKDETANINNPPPQCPAGYMYNGQQCVPQTGPGPTTTTTTTTTTTAPPPPIPTAQPGPNATPLDATAAAAAVQLLGPLAQQYAPAGATQTSGGSLAGNFAQGQSLEIQVQMQPGKCYTVVGAALPTVQNLDIQLAPVSPIPGVNAPVVGQDKTTGPTAVVGEKPNCFKWAAPIAGPMRVILTVSAGQGVAAAQVYEK
jgi:hypothetical protein